MQSAVYWFTGLSAAGKTTKLKSRGEHVIYLDGDVLRHVFAVDGGSYTQDARLRNALQYGRMCKMLSDQNVHVVIATIALFHLCHEWNRRNISNYVEIFIHAPFEVLRQRDTKGIYVASEHVMGVHIPAEYPLNPHYTINNDGTRSPEYLVEVLYNSLFSGSVDNKINEA